MHAFLSSRKAWRVAASVLVLGTGAGAVQASGAAQLIYGAQEPAGRPYLQSDSQTPLFDRLELWPGQQHSACLAVRPMQGSTRQLELTGRVAGELSRALLTSIEAGHGNDPGSGHNCSDFRPSRSLWSGTMDSLPSGSQAIEDSVALTSGHSRVYRVTVLLPEQSTPTRQQRATVDLTWSADLTADRSTLEKMSPQRQREETLSIPQNHAAPERCVAFTAPQLRVRERLDGQSVSLLVGTGRPITDADPLRIAIEAPRGLVRRAALMLSGKPVSFSLADGAIISRSRLAATTRTMLRARVWSANGASRVLSAEMSRTDCPSVMSAHPHTSQPRTLRLRIDAVQFFDGASVDLPARLLPKKAIGSMVTWQAGTVTSRSEFKISSSSKGPQVKISGQRVEIRGLPKATGMVELLLQYPAGQWSKIKRILRCETMSITARLSGLAKIERTRAQLMGSQSCPVVLASTHRSRS
jgi:hypothetical protein